MDMKDIALFVMMAILLVLSIYQTVVISNLAKNSKESYAAGIVQKMAASTQPPIKIIGGALASGRSSS